MKRCKQGTFSKGEITGLSTVTRQDASNRREHPRFDTAAVMEKTTNAGCEDIFKDRNNDVLILTNVGVTG